jgi:hypothetical protein
MSRFVHSRYQLVGKVCKSLQQNKNRVGKQIRAGIFCALNHSIFQLTEDAISKNRVKILLTKR